jgi:hypothetical protein
MATVTLTLVADEQVIRKAEEVAARNQTDLPSLIKSYLSELAATQELLDESKLPPVTRSALGSLKDIPDKPHKELLTDALVEKHGWKG